VSGPAPEGFPRVSVITPVWNAAATLEETVASVRAQSLSDWEMLLVDDGSTDGSAALIAHLAAEEPRIRALATGVNGGAGVARNLGIRAARGRYIAFLDADDRWRPEKLSHQIGFMAARGHALVFSAYRRMDVAGRPGAVVGVPASGQVGYDELLKRNVIGCLTAVYDTALLGKVEMPDIRRRQDYALWLRLLRRIPAAYGLPEVLADYRVGAGSLSGNKLVAAGATWRLYRDIEKLSPPRAAYCFAHYATQAALDRLAGAFAGRGNAPGDTSAGPGAPHSGQ
jgi:teichuronic acid biosynthesis glycosyltransferase TuaG